MKDPNTVVFGSGLTLPDVLEHRIAVDGPRTFLVCERSDGRTEELTYGQLGERVARLASGLRDLGVDPGDRVVIHLGNGPEIVAAMLAVAAAGAVAVPTITAYSADELRYAVEHCGAKVVISEARFLRVVGAVADAPAVEHVVVARDDDVAHDHRSWAEVLEGGTPMLDVVSRPPEAAAFVMYSSGTTARPKGIVLSHAACVHAAEANAQHQRLQPRDRAICGLPLFHVNAQFIQLMPALATGSSLVVLENFSPSRYWSQVRRYRATVANLVGTAVRLLLAQPPADEDGSHDLRFLTFGLQLSPEDAARFEERFRVPLVNLWGMTENIATGTRAPLYLPRRPEMVGMPMLGCAVKLEGPGGEDVATGEPGELLFSGPTMTEYLHDPDTTAVTVGDGWLRTGDTVRADERGYFAWVDRRKDMIKVSGENVAPTEVERVLAEHGDVADCAVVGEPHEIKDEVVVAFVVLRDGARLDEDALRAHCAEQLAPFKVPQRLLAVEDLPRTSVGKIRKAPLRARLAEEPAAARAAKR